MHKFTTTSGKCLWYDMNTNRIGLWTPFSESQAYPIVRFKAPDSFCVDKITMFTIEVTQQCNLHCAYCCYSGGYRNRRKHNPKEISFNVLDNTIRFIEEHADENADEITVCFYGGEALLAKSKIQYLIDKLNVVLGDRVCYSLSTNGYALTESVVDWICRYEKFFVNVTIDGNKTMHDTNRMTENGDGSYETIYGNLSRFKEKYPEQYNHRIRFLSTVYSLDGIKRLSDIWDSIDALKGHHPVHIGLIIPNFSDCRRVYDTIESKTDFYADAFQDIKNGIDSIKASRFRKLISIVGRRSYFPLSTEMKIKTCLQELFSCYINADGELYACEKFCDEYGIGDVFSGFDENKMVRLSNAFTERKNEYCQSCWAQRLCRMCLTGLNHTNDEMERMCNMERETIELALKYFCDNVDWEQPQKRNDNSKSRDK